MNQKPTFTDDELYIIEREFDNLHSLASRRYTDVLAQFFALHSICTRDFTVLEGHSLTPEQLEEEKRTILMQKELISHALALIESRVIYKSVSDKVEKWRKSR